MIDPAKIANTAKALRKPHVNSSCIGCGVCTAIGEEAFTLNDDGLSVVVSIPEYENKGVDDAISACPVRAISWQPCDAEGIYSNGVTEHKDIMQ